MRYIAITWRDYLKDPEYWHGISNFKRIPLHVSMNNELAID